MRIQHRVDDRVSVSIGMPALALALIALAFVLGRWFLAGAAICVINELRLAIGRYYRRRRP